MMKNLVKNTALTVFLFLLCVGSAFAEIGDENENSIFNSQLIYGEDSRGEAFTVKKQLDPLSQEYAQKKSTGKILPTQQTNYQGSYKSIPPSQIFSTDSLIVPLDTSFTLALGANDDGSTGQISFPFTFDFYGTPQTSFYINNNGNVSFGASYSTYSSSGFPINNFPMLAPFWGDVDTSPAGNGSGLVHYRIDSTSVIVTWDGVGYYNSQVDKLNTFQVIFTNGNDPLIGAGNNVAFSYDDMQWTTGSASGGSNGFGGTPATVGVNKGDGVDFALIGRFDHAGIDYDGPSGNNDGVSYLDYKDFIFNTSNSQNIPPVSVGFPTGEITMFVGDTTNITVQFLSPETNQVTQTVITNGNIPDFNFVINDGNVSTIDILLIATANNVGFHQIQFDATDDGIPIQTTSKLLEVRVLSHPPIVQNSNIVTDEDIPLNVTLIASDIDGDILSFSIIGNPVNGVLGTINPISDSSAIVSYTPNAEFFGSDSLTFNVDDGFGNLDTAIVSITVNPVNDAPVVVDTVATTIQDQVVTITFEGSDIEGDSLMFSIVDQPSNGTLGAITGSNFTSSSVVYTPNAGFYGADSLTFQANDGTDNSNIAKALITVNGIPVIAVAPDSFDVSLNNGQTFVDNLTITNNGVVDLTYSLSTTNLSPLAPVSSQKTTPSIFGNLPDIPKGSSIQDGIGFPQINSVGGPDNFGYSWKDSNEPGGPVYNWTDISGTGTQATISNCLDCTQSVTLPFTFSYYGNNYTSTVISTKGNVHFGTPDFDYTNTGIPGSDGPSAMIAAFWDDIDPSVGGDIFYQTIGNNFIVQWEGVARWQDVASNLTFQIILSQNGSIKFQYNSMVGTINSATVGIENAAEDDGLEVVFNSSYVTNNLAILFTSANTNWLSLSQSTGTVPAGSFLDIDVTFDATGLSKGDYEADIEISSNDPNNPLVTVNADLTVTNTAPTVSSANFTTNENQAITISLTGSDVDGDSLIFSLASSPSNGTLGAITPINKTTSEVVFTPNAGFIGSDSFDFQASDGTLLSNTGTIGITVNSVPTVSDVYDTTAYETAKTISLSGADADNDQLTFLVLTPPANGNLGTISSTGLFTADVFYTPNNGFSGADSFEVVANDGFTNSNSAWAFLTVEPPNDPPFMDFTNDPGFSNSFVHPDTGSSQSIFSFEIDYFDVNGDFPNPGFPKIKMDFENDGSFTGPNDLSFELLEADPNDTDVANGKRYIFYSTGGIPASQNWNYSLEAQDSFGASAPPKQETPTVSDDLLDVKIFADDIVFSNLNPAIGELVTISATIHNSSDYDANNFVVSLYEEDTFVNSITVPNLSAQNQTTVSWTYTYTAEQFYPMKVVIDETNVLVEDNELNNFAIRPVTVGNYTIPGNINVVANLLPSTTFGNETVRLTGNAQYSGVFGTNFNVSGANVTFTIVETGATYSGNTNNVGDFNLFFTAPVVPGTYTITGSVTDLTLNETFGPLPLTILSQPADPDLVCNVSLSDYSPIVNTPVNGTATVSNIGDDVSGPFSFRYYTAQGNVATQTITNLNPGASQTFNFTQTYTTVGGNFINGYADYTGIVSEKNESNNTDYHYVNVRSDKPDLTPSNNNIWGSHNVNNPYGFGIRVQNRGGVSAGAFDVKVYDNGSLIHTESVSGLNASAQTFVNFSYIFPSAGIHTITVNVDEPIGSGFIVEENENNNVYTGSINVYTPLMNLNVSANDLNVSPNPPTAGSSMDLIATIRNNGESAIISGAPIEVNFILDENGSQTTFTETYTGGLAIGGSTTLTKTVTTPAYGNNSYTVQLDPNNTQTESNEYDNSASVSLCWDFYLRDIPFPVPGHIDFWVNDIVQGTSVPLKIYLQNFGVFNASNLETRFFVDGNLVGTETKANVSKHSDQIIGSSVNYTFSTPGTYTVSWQTDFPNDFIECDESNNTYSATVTVLPVLPDLFIESAYIIPSELNPDPGENITIALNYDNKGQLNSDSVTVKLLLDDIQVGNTIKVPGLAAGEDTTVTDASWVWSSNLVGTHVIRGLVDFTNEIAELDETNNEASRTLPVGESANLFFADVTFSDSLPSIGDLITINVEVGNSGDLDCDADLEFYYIDDLQDTLFIGNVDKITVLKNDSITTSIDWTVLDSVTTIIGKIVNSNPSEATYTDNEFSRPIGGLPFAIVQVLPTSFTKDFNVGDAPVTDTLFIENQGTGSLLYSVTSLATFVSESKSTGTILPSGVDTVIVTLGNSSIDVGVETASIIVSSNAVNSPTETVPVTLTYHGAMIDATSFVNFGTVFNGTNNPQPITISNLGDADLEVTNIDLPANGNFAVDVTFPFTILPLGQQVVNLTWTPQTEGAVLETITIHSDDFNDAAQAVSVTGISIPAAYYHNFDYTTTFPPGWSTSATVGDNQWILIDEPLSSNPGDKSMWVEGTTFAPNAPKGQSQISATVNTSLESSLYDCSTYSTVKVMYYHNYVAGFETAPEGGYVEVSTDGGTTYPNVVAYYNSSTSGNEDFDISGIAAGQSAVKVRFRYEVTDGNSWTVDDFFVGDTTVLANVAPTQVTTAIDLENATLTSFEIGWSGSFDIDFATYEIHFSETSNFATSAVWDSNDDPLLSDQNANQTTVTDVFPSYYWAKVRGVDAQGNFGNFSNAVQISMPNLISDVKIESAGSQMKLTWQEVNNADLTVTGYNVYRDVTPDFVPDVLNQVGANVTDEDGSSVFQWTDTGVSTLPNSSYFYTVQAEGTFVPVIPFASNNSSKNLTKVKKKSSKQTFSKMKSVQTVKAKTLTNEQRKQRRERQFEVMEILKLQNSENR